MHNLQVGGMISGSATTFEAFCLNVAANNLPIEVPLLIADRSEANLRVAQRINEMLGWDIKPVLIDRPSFPAGPAERKWDLTDQQSERILELVTEEHVDLVSQQGWLSRTRGVFFDEFGSVEAHNCSEEARLLNNHPGITSETVGKWGSNVHEHALANAKRTGLMRTAFTMHVVTANYDEGAVVSEHFVPILETDAVKDIERSVQQVEKANTATDILAFGQRRVEFLATA